ncbi:MAG: hypothetical protein CMA72_05370 [Euryarchaeota archaeon]|nr:hypothetical protein [Euryarchaeota archaeon]
MIREVGSKNSQEGLYLIHYVGFDSSWDEWVDSSRIKRS